MRAAWKHQRNGDLSYVSPVEKTYTYTVWHFRTNWLNRNTQQFRLDEPNRNIRNACSSGPLRQVGDECGENAGWELPVLKYGEIYLPHILSPSMPKIPASGQEVSDGSLMQTPVPRHESSTDFEFGSLPGWYMERPKCRWWSVHCRE